MKRALLLCMLYFFSIIRPAASSSFDYSSDLTHIDPRLVPSSITIQECDSFAHIVPVFESYADSKALVLVLVDIDGVLLESKDKKYSLINQDIPSIVKYMQTKITSSDTPTIVLGLTARRFSSANKTRAHLQTVGIDFATDFVKGLKKFRCTTNPDMGYKEGIIYTRQSMSEPRGGKGVALNIFLNLNLKYIIPTTHPLKIIAIDDQLQYIAQVMEELERRDITGSLFKFTKPNNVTALLEAICFPAKILKKNRMKLVMSLLQSKAPINGKKNDGITPLIAASYYNYVEFVDMFLTSIANMTDLDETGKLALINEQDLTGKTALIHAVNNNPVRIDLIQKLLDAKADPTIQDATGKNALQSIDSLTCTQDNFHALLALLEPTQKPAI